MKQLSRSYPTHRFMNQFFRLLLLAPATFSSVMSLAIAAKPAHATTQNWVTITRDVTCMQTPVREGRQLVCKRVKAGANETAKST